MAVAKKDAQTEDAQTKGVPINKRKDKTKRVVTRNKTKERTAIADKN